MSGQFHDTALTNSAIVPEIWTQRFYDVLRVSLPFNESVSQDWSGDIQDLGDQVNIPQIPDFDEASELSEGAAGDADLSTAVTFPLVINKRSYKDFKVTKKAQLQSIPFVDQLREKAVFAIMKRVQQVIIDNIVPSASAPDHQISYDSGTTLALADILEAKELLDAQDVPNEDRFMTLGSAQWNDLYNITGFTSKDFVPSGSPVSNAQFDFPLLGFQARLTTAAGNVAYFHHMSFLTMAMQQQLNVEEHNLGADGIRGMRVNTDILWGVKQLDNKRVVTIS